jgi:uncharacterized protein (TIGR03790 family)
MPSTARALRIGLTGLLLALAPLASALDASQLGLIINVDDPYSVAIGEYYKSRRAIPADNIVLVRLPVGTAEISRHTFAPIKSIVDSALPDHVQALAIAWTSPSRVECNSITSALARGFAPEPCDAEVKSPTCGLIAPSPYFNSPSRRPFTDFGMRPAMLLAAPDLESGKALIDRGIAADGTRPRGSAYLMKSGDATRSLRAQRFDTEMLGKRISPFVDVRIVEGAAISNRDDALFYFQGRTTVEALDSNRFPPGAIVDNLTSFGGMLTDPRGGQISALEFIRHGATGSFGTVSEPCAHASKFPDPAVLIKRYTGGETLIEAYWKSVLVTFQGLFIGEPLASPWRGENPQP